MIICSGAKGIGSRSEWIRSETCSCEERIFPRLLIRADELAAIRNAPLLDLIRWFVPAVICMD
jgi:hypothetical protein